MFHSMYARLFAIFLAILIVMASAGAVFTVITIRDNVTNNRLESLMVEAREIAFLASRVGLTSLSDYLDGDTPTEVYLRWKAAAVYDEYDAYILIVDRNGRVMDNALMASADNPGALESLTATDLADALREVLSGKEVRARILNAAKGVIFTVAAPWVQDDSVLGAVFIHTSAQVIETEYRGIVLQILTSFALAALLAAIFAMVYTRSIVKPLTVITSAAEAMSRGNFKQRAEVTGVDEVRQLAGAFNVMADRLGKVEQSRREFVANVSHELRSPVTSIHGFVEGMLDGTIPEDQHTQYLQIVGDETNRLKKLINDLLQLSRMEKGAEPLAMTEFDINEAIRRVLIGRMNDIERLKLNMQLDFESEPMMVYADRDRIAQVLHNLVDNALKFIYEAGRLTISTALVHDKVTVTVINDGAPIPPQDQPHIFERFYKADKAHTSGKGTGLGLSICKQIMEAHGESIALLPRQEGAAFAFTLRAAPATHRADSALPQ